MMERDKSRICYLYQNSAFQGSNNLDLFYVGIDVFIIYYYSFRKL